jgi:hypothetical protein
MVAPALRNCTSEACCATVCSEHVIPYDVTRYSAHTGDVNDRRPFTTASVDSALPGDEDVLCGATIREVSPAVFSSGSARSARRLYKATVRHSISLC